MNGINDVYGQVEHDYSDYRFDEQNQEEAYAYAFWHAVSEIKDAFRTFNAKDLLAELDEETQRKLKDAFTS